MLSKAICSPHRVEHSQILAGLARMHKEPKEQPCFRERELFHLKLSGSKMVSGGQIYFSIRSIKKGIY